MDRGVVALGLEIQRRNDFLQQIIHVDGGDSEGGSTGPGDFEEAFE